MPKETYFHLSPEKQRRILDAATDEVINVPISEISINRIIQKAEISRGSFYQYFVDKQDLICFVFSDAVRFIKEEISRCIEESQGDIFDSIATVLEGVFSLGQREPYRRMLRNVLVESSTRESSYQFLKQLQTDILVLFFEKMDKGRLCLKDDGEYWSLVKVLFILLKEAAISYLYDGEKPDLHRADFSSQLKMIKEGVLRKE